MPSTSFLTSVLVASSFAVANAHLGAWTDGMFCPNNAHNPPMKDPSGFARFIDPLYQMEKEDWWFQHVRGCDRAMPRGVLKIPANGEFTANISDVVQGASKGFYAAGYDDESKFDRSSEGCITYPNMHTKSKATAAGTAFAIAYVSTIAEVTPENLVVFSVAPNTPYERIARYKVPDLAACPTDGCICAWGWVPDGCGQQNMYMQGHKCQVTNAKASGRKPGKAVAPGPGVKGPKQLIYAFQKSGNNYKDRTPSNQVPTYSSRMGYMDGAQTDIFEGSVGGDATPAPATTPATTPVSTSSPKPSPSPKPVAPAPTSSKPVAPAPTSSKPATPKPSGAAPSPAGTVKCSVKKY